jgi:hypothetical protein
MNNPHRLSPVKISYPYLDADSVFFLIPEGYKVEAVPNEINLKPTFGSFVYKTVVSGDTAIIFHRELEIKNYQIPAKDYKEYRNFWMDVVKADRAKVVLVKNE